MVAGAAAVAFAAVAEFGHFYKPIALLPLTMMVVSLSSEAAGFGSG